jgi:hypothetical protein
MNDEWGKCEGAIMQAADETPQQLKIVIIFNSITIENYNNL